MPDRERSTMKLSSRHHHHLMSACQAEDYNRTHSAARFKSSASSTLRNHTAIRRLRTFDYSSPRTAHSEVPSSSPQLYQFFHELTLRPNATTFTRRPGSSQALCGDELRPFGLSRHLFHYYRHSARFKLSLSVNPRACIPYRFLFVVPRGICFQNWYVAVVVSSALAGSLPTERRFSAASAQMHPLE